MHTIEISVIDCFYALSTINDIHDGEKVNKEVSQSLSKDNPNIFSCIYLKKEYKHIYAKK